MASSCEIAGVGGRERAALFSDGTTPTPAMTKRLRAAEGTCEQHDEAAVHRVDKEVVCRKRMWASRRQRAAPSRSSQELHGALVRHNRRRLQAQRTIFTRGGALRRKSAHQEMQAVVLRGGLARGSCRLLPATHRVATDDVTRESGALPPFKQKWVSRNGATCRSLRCSLCPASPSSSCLLFGVGDLLAVASE